MLKKSYPGHVQELQKRVEEALEATGFEGLVLHSGTPLSYYADDQEAPFRSTPHFAHWVPLESPGNLLLIRPGEKPLLVHYAPEDYWYEQLPLGGPFWAGSFEIKQVGKAEQTFEKLPRNGKFAFHGDCPVVAEKNGFAPEAINPAELIARLDWNRAYKTPYEIECIDGASRLAAMGHKAARDAFEAGASELGIHQAYLKAVDCTEADLPFPSIVALDEKAAFLHYERKRKDVEGSVFLIDCGARYLGYASDITRTWTRPHCDGLFRGVVERFHELQKELCAGVRPGVPFPDLHHQAHILIGNLLHEVGVLKVGGVEAAARHLTEAFLPHGLGHFLGVQVHDVGGHQAEPAGGIKAPPEEYRFLRTTRLMEENQVLTIEPGLYFIEMLLRPHRTGPDKDAFDWGVVDRLSPCGGVRIEDDVVVTADGHRNLTRKYLP
jgi:Xaa-Pro dipeptidase